MSLEVYKKDFSNRYQITHAISIHMSRHYNEIGKISIVIPADDYNVNALEVDGVIYDTESGTTYTIQNIKYDSPNNWIFVNGFTSDWLLNKRCVATKRQVGQTETVEDVVYDIFNSNLRSLPRISAAHKDGYADVFGDKLTNDDGESSVYGGQLMDEIVTLLNLADMGHRMEWDAESNSFAFKVYKGQDLTEGIHAVVFSEEMGTAADLTVTDDNTTFKNVVYMPIQKSDQSESVYEYGTASGAERYEYWSNATAIQSKDMKWNDFIADVKKDCAEILSDRLRRQTFTVDVDAEDLGKAYSLGDKVACVSIKYGVQFVSRITGVKYTLDVTGQTTSLILGEPILTALMEEKLNG